MALSRQILDLHYPSDIMAGALIVWLLVVFSFELSVFLLLAV